MSQTIEALLAHSTSEKLDDYLMAHVRMQRQARFEAFLARDAFTHGDVDFAVHWQKTSARSYAAARAMFEERRPYL